MTSDCESQEYQNIELRRTEGLPTRFKPTISKGSVRNNCKTAFKMMFEYLICIDVEATCWADTHMLYTKDDAEIIEFPAVLVNLQTGLIEAEFSHYVKPTKFPILSEFCKNLTGITQDDVDKASPIDEILKLFDEWIRNFVEIKSLEFNDSVDKKQNLAICTWTDYDIGVYLKGECKRKSIDLPSYFNRRIDAMIAYKKWRHERRRIKFTHALQNAGIRFQGRLHSGIDDARNLARLMVKMTKCNHKLSITNY